MTAKGLNQNSPEARCHLGCLLGSRQKWRPLSDRPRTSFLIPEDGLQVQMALLKYQDVMDMMDMMDMMDKD